MGAAGKKGITLLKYQFNAPIDRTHAFSAKYDEAEKKFGRADVLPLWIADMDLPTAQPIHDAITKRNTLGMFGYTSRPASYFEAVRDWQQRHNGWSPEIPLMSHSVGVVPAMCTVVREFSNPGDEILFLTPVYSEFFNVVEDWDRTPLTCPLHEKDGVWSIDFAAFEAALAKKPAFFILCNPHNPVGRVWTREELSRMDELCRKHGVMVVSDEIHSDLMLWGNRHIPFASLNAECAANTITCISATKTFNLAGLQASITIFPDQQAKQKYAAFWSKLDIHRNNCFSLVAVEAAFREGDEWLEQLLRHLEHNMEYVRDYLAAHIPEITVTLPESTYLLWLDCCGLGLEGDALPDFFANDARLGLNDGRAFGIEGGYMRLNVACPISFLEEAMRRLLPAVEALRAKQA